MAQAPRQTSPNRGGKCTASDAIHGFLTDFFSGTEKEIIQKFISFLNYVTNWRGLVGLVCAAPCPGSLLILCSEWMKPGCKLLAPKIFWSSFIIKQVLFLHVFKIFTCAHTSSEVMLLIHCGCELHGAYYFRSYFSYLLFYGDFVFDLGLRFLRVSTSWHSCQERGFCPPPLSCSSLPSGLVLVPAQYAQRTGDFLGWLLNTFLEPWYYWFSGSEAHWGHSG